MFAGLVPENDHVLMHLVVSAETVGESIEHLAKYFAVGFGAARLTLSREHGKLVATYTAPDPGEPSQIADAVVALCANYLRRFAEKPASVTIELGKRRGTAEDYKKLIGVPVVVDAERTALSIPLRALPLRLKSGNREMCARLVERADAELAARLLPGGFLAEVRMIVTSQVEQGGADSVAAIADALKISRRTLARKLASEGTTYQALLDDVRSVIAARHLAEGATVAQVAERLGFADTSSFTRAFRRWTGKTPSATRRGTSRTP
jgi:AraC-like DNA-binding protein